MCFEGKNIAKTQRTRGIEYFDSLNTFSSKQKLQQVLKSWSNFSLVLFGNGQEIQSTTLTNPSNNYAKSMWQLMTSPCIKLVNKGRCPKNPVLFGLFRAFYFVVKMRGFSDKIPCICLGLWTPTHQCIACFGTFLDVCSKND